MQYVDDLAVVMVTLCDYMTRKFQRRLRRKQQRHVTSSSTSSVDDVTDDDVTDDDKEYEYLAGIEDALDSCRTKLRASHARSRISAQVRRRTRGYLPSGSGISAQVLSIDALLPSRVRQNDQLASRMVVSAWVNFRKTRCSAVKITYNPQ